MMSTVKAFVAAIMTQQIRDRTSFFFMLILPVAIIVIIGSTFGGPNEIEMVVVDESTDAQGAQNAAEIVELLDRERDVTVSLVGDVSQARRDLRRFDVEGVIVVSADGTFGFISNAANEGGFAARSVAQRIVDRVGAGVLEADPNDVEVVSVGDDRFASQGSFALTSAQNLVLFTFITALTSSVILVRARRSGVLQRSLVSPAGAEAITLGLGAGWMILALVQTAIIVAVGALAFGVDWGDPLAATLLTLVFCLVGTGAGLLVGAAFSSEDTVASATPPVALVLAAIGGCMVPTEVFPDALVRVSKLTPHHWAMEGWKKLLFDSASLGDLTTELAILFGFAATLLTAASLMLRRSLVN